MPTSGPRPARAPRVGAPHVRQRARRASASHLGGSAKATQHLCDTYHKEEVLGHHLHAALRHAARRGLALLRARLDDKVAARVKQAPRHPRLNAIVRFAGFRHPQLTQRRRDATFARRGRL